MPSFAKSIPAFFAILLMMACSPPKDAFRRDFEKALRPDFTSADLQRMMSEHSRLLFGHSEVVRMGAAMEGESLPEFPLRTFGTESLYLRNIQRLLESTNSNQRTLAYLVIANTGDTTHNSRLFERLLPGPDSASGRIWAAMALLRLGSKNTTPLFDFLADNETVGDAHMFPLFLQLDRDSLRQTAYRRIASPKTMARILAAQTLAATGSNPTTDHLLKEAVKTWEWNTKGYAVFSIKELRMGNLLETLRPLLDSQATRAIALGALANSPTETDRQFLVSLSHHRPLSPELFGALKSSQRTDNAALWLALLASNPLPKGTSAYLGRNSVVASDSLLPALQTALRTIADTAILEDLVRALAGRSDDSSVEILSSLLRHPGASVRYWTAMTLRGNSSPRWRTELPALLRDSSLRSVALTQLAIDAKLDNLQGVFDSLYAQPPRPDWKSSALDYLSVFPLAYHQPLLRQLLATAPDAFTQRKAAMGLARLGDAGSVDAIVAACEKESAKSDLNARPYLEALALLKGDKAKAQIAKYSRSKTPSVAELATRLLAVQKTAESDR